MGGIELRGGTLVVERAPNQLDELAIACSRILAAHDVDHVFVSGYVAILAGRARSTEAIDVLIEPVTADTANRLAADLDQQGFWGPAMPLSSVHEMLSAGDPSGVAPDGQVSPHLDMRVVDDEFDRASLEHAILARIGSASIPIELQIADKRFLGTPRDVEDADHRRTLLGERRNPSAIEQWSERVGVEAEYERLERA